MKFPFLLLLSFLLSSAASAQVPTPVKLLSAGDPVPGTGHNLAPLGFIAKYRVNNGGDWIARLRLDDPSPASDGVFLRNGQVVFREGDPVAQPVGGVVNVVASCDLADTGEAFYVMSTSGWPSPAVNRSVIYRDTQPILVVLDRIDAPGYSPAAYYQSILGVTVVEGPFVLVTCSLVDPAASNQVVGALVRFKLDSAGNRLNETVLATVGMVLPGQTVPLDQFYTSDGSQSLNNTGDGTFNARLAAAAGSQDQVVFASGTLIAQSNTPSPIPGRNYGDTTAAPSDSNEAGSWILRYDLDSSNPLDDEVIVVDGTVVAQKGGPAPVFGTTFASFDQTSVHVDQGGNPYFGAVLNGAPAGFNRGIFRGNSVLMRAGATFVQGQQLTEIYLNQSSLQVSNDGNFILVRGELDGSGESLVLMERSIATHYCDAEPNSAGNVALLQASGSSKASFNTVSFRCLSLPSNQSGYLLASMAQADIFMPPGSQGRLCLGAPTARFNSDVQNTLGGSIMVFNPDLSNVPLTPAVSVQAGQTWNFQVWYRDINPGQTSNFSLPVSIEFR